MINSLDLTNNHGVIASRNVVHAIDADKDGRIDYDEFKASIFNGQARDK